MENGGGERTSGTTVAESHMAFCSKRDRDVLKEELRREAKMLKARALIVGGLNHFKSVADQVARYRVSDSF